MIGVEGVGVGPEGPGGWWALLTKLRSAGFLLWSPQPAGFLWEGEGWRTEKTASIYAVNPLLSD